MQFQLEVLKKTRMALLRLIDGLTIDQLNTIPKGFSNNIIWNVAHLVVTQQILCYRLAGLPMYVEDEFVDTYKKGSAPQGVVSETEVLRIKALLLELPGKLTEDLEKKIFKPFDGYTTSLNVTLSDITSAIAFNNFHEGIHLGVVLSIRKLV